MSHTSTHDDRTRPASPALTTVQRLYEAFTAGDLRRLRDLLDPAAVWSQADGPPHGGDAVLHGPDQVLQRVVEPTMAQWQDFTEPVDRMIDADPEVVALGRYHGTHAATGRHIDAEFAHVWTIHDGRVVSFKQYADTAQIRKAAGMDG